MTTKVMPSAPPVSSTDPIVPLADDTELTTGLERWKWAGLIGGLLLASTFLAYQALESDRLETARTDLESAAMRTGAELWEANCADCHGERGEGDKGPALNAKEYLSDATEARTRAVIQAGMPGTKMDAWWNGLGGPLTDDQIRSIVTYVYSWSDDAPSVPNWRDPRGTGGPVP